MTELRRLRLVGVRRALLPLMAVVLAGCSTQPAGQPPGTQVAGAAVDTASPAAPAQTEATPSPSPAATEASTPPPGPTPTIRLGLHATDPGSVVLASGRPQLVEFFAFW